MVSGCIVKVWFEPGFAERSAQVPFLIIETELPDFATFCELVDGNRLIGGAILMTGKTEDRGVFRILRRHPIAFRGEAVMRCQLPGFVYIEDGESHGA